MRRSSCARNTKTIRLENEDGAKIKDGSREPKRALRVAAKDKSCQDKSCQDKSWPDKSSKTEPNLKKKAPRPVALKQIDN
jgi:hypothetical protein